MSSWYDFDENAEVSCRCGWTGPTAAGGIEVFSECFSYECPECGRTLAVFSPPTIEETKPKAAEGNEKARGELASALRRERFLEKASNSELKTGSQLPELTGEEILIEWDFDDPPEDRENCWTVLRHNRVEIWREIAYYEGRDRYFEIAGILREKYGHRLIDLRPTEASYLYLFGDDLNASSEIDAFRRRLNHGA